MPLRPHILPSIPRRQLYLSPPLRLRQKPSPPDDYYSLLLSSPLPATNPSPTPPSSPPSQNQNTNSKTARPSHKPPRNPRIVFGSRLAGPAERREKIARAGEMAERPKEPDNCCMSGCVHCVWDIYREEVEEWAARRKEREGALRSMGGSDEGGVGDLDGMGGGFEGIDVGQEGLFESVPVGIREFMATEKRLRQRRGEKG